MQRETTLVEKHSNHIWWPYIDITNEIQIKHENDDEVNLVLSPVLYWNLKKAQKNNADCVRTPIYF